MVDYNDGKWHGWNGGECPVHPETVVEVIFDDGSGAGEHNTADVWRWNVNTAPVAFRVIKEHKEPREFWVWNDTLYENEKMCRNHAAMFGGEIILVREVIE